MPVPKLIDEGPGWAKYQLDEAQMSLTFRQVIALWQESVLFQSQFSHWLCEPPYDAIFFECRPVNRATQDAAFEYVVADAPPLAACTEDSYAFASYFGPEPVVNFANLGGDAELIVPCPTHRNSCYAHLKTFLVTGKADQIAALWQCVGERAAVALDDRHIWISTSGLGVSWLHVRIDRFPKYYTHTPYRSL